MTQMTSVLMDHAIAEIRAEMGRQRISQRQLAPKVGMAQGQLSQRLSGTVPLRINELEVIAAVLGVPVSQFLNPQTGAAVRDNAPGGLPNTPASVTQ
jgi:transcriptional regulator with XRE-family HTH domain